MTVAITPWFRYGAGASLHTPASCVPAPQQGQESYTRLGQPTPCRRRHQNTPSVCYPQPASQPPIGHSLPHRARFATRCNVLALLRSSLHSAHCSALFFPTQDNIYFVASFYSDVVCLLPFLPCARGVGMTGASLSLGKGGGLRGVRAATVQFSWQQGSEIHE